MKTFTLFFAILIFSISFNNKLSANPPDSCLKMVIPDEPELWYINPDSLKRVSDIGSSKAEMKAEFEQIVNTFSENITDLKNISYDYRVNVLVSIDDDKITLSNVGNIFPNPVNSIINISSFADINVESISIYDITRLKVLDTKYSDQIDVSQLQPGTYFIRIGNNSYKFVKVN